MTSGAKRITRDFYLNNRSVEDTESYMYFDTDFSVRRTVKKYNLQHRPPIIVRADELCLQ